MVAFVRDNVKYELNDINGFINSVSVAIKKDDDKKYIVSLDLFDLGFDDDHIRLEVKRKSTNPLRNIFGSKLVAMTRIRITEGGSSLWDALKRGEIKYPKNGKYYGIVSQALTAINGKLGDIQEDMYAVRKEYKKQKEKAVAEFFRGGFER